MLYTKRFTQKFLFRKIHVEKGYICQQAKKQYVNVCFTDKNIMHKGDPVKLNFEGPEMQK